MQNLAPAWTPSPERVRDAKVTAFIAWLSRERGIKLADYHDLWNWSVTDIDAFWCAVWDYFAIPSATPRGKALADARMPGADWFPGVSLNYIEQVFRHASNEHPAIVFRNEAGEDRDVSWSELQRQVGALAASLRAMNVSPIGLSKLVSRLVLSRPPRSKQS